LSKRKTKEKAAAGSFCLPPLFLFLSLYAFGSFLNGFFSPLFTGAS